MIKTGQKQNQLRIVITRHGPKDGLNGVLTPQGRELVFAHYINFTTQETNEFKNGIIFQRKLVSSPIRRALQTAKIFKNVLELNLDSSLEIDIERDDRLSEKNLTDFVLNLPPEKRSDWFRYWYYSSDGSKTIRAFCNWLIEQMQNQKLNRSNIEINAFSHGPVMAGFVLRLEDMLGKKIISNELSSKDRMDFVKLFAARSSLFNYLGTLELIFRSDKPNFFTLNIQGIEIEIPESALMDI